MPEMQPTDVRSTLLSTLRPMSAAWSVDGRTVRFVTDFSLGVEVGGFVTVTTTDGARLLVQVHQLDVTSRNSIRAELDPSLLEGELPAVSQATVDVVTRVIDGVGEVVDRLDGGRRLIPSFDDEVAGYFDRAAGKETRIVIGELRNTSIPAGVRAKGFARHTFMCGQSGSGKTFSLGVVLERLLHDTELPVIIIDPNSDYVNLGRLDSRTAINRFASAPMSKEEYDQLAADYAERSGVRVASARGGDLPLSIHLSDLPVDEQALTMRLDPIADPGLFHALRSAGESFGDRPYDLHDLVDVLTSRFDDESRRLARRIANLGIADWSVWARSDEPSLPSIINGQLGRSDRWVLVYDTGSLTNPDERSVAVLGLMGRLRRRPQKRPVSIVIDEAHNVCPPVATSRIEQALVDTTVWIAGEGRKYGLYLLLSTQRPQKIHTNVLSQCDNLLLMRMNSDGDLDELERVFSHVPSSMIRRARAHQMGEMLAAGPIAPTPLRLQVGARWTREGGADLPTGWANPVR